MVETFFWLFAAGAVVSAVMCILRRNPVAAAMWLVATMFSLAGIFLLLSAPFIAAIQVLVYAGAIMVLFLFVIMLLNLTVPASDLRGPMMVAGTVAVVGLLVVELAALWRYTPERLAEEMAQGPAMADPAAAFPTALVGDSGNVVLEVARPLFDAFLVPFEVTSVLLLAAIVGAVVLAKRRI
jgi:NADH-quinone oxidoreductase subunit J